MSTTAPYQRIADWLRDMILRGELAPGTSVPSENYLAEKFECARNTATRAVKQLVSEGLIITRQGARSVVAGRPTMVYLASGENFRKRQATGKTNDVAEAAAQDHKAWNDLFAVDIGHPAPEEIAERLRIDAGAPVTVRRMIHRVDGRPMKFLTSYYRQAFAAGTALEVKRRIVGSAAVLIEAEDGPFRRTLSRAEEEVELRMPTPFEAEELHIPAGVPVGRFLRTLYDVDDDPLEVLDSLLPGDRYTFKFVTPIPPKN